MAPLILVCSGAWRNDWPRRTARGGNRGPFLILDEIAIGVLAAPAGTALPDPALPDFARSVPDSGQLHLTRAQAKDSLSDVVWDEHLTGSGH